jgi:hypothetical protein
LTSLCRGHSICAAIAAWATSAVVAADAPAYDAPFKAPEEYSTDEIKEIIKNHATDDRFEKLGLVSVSVCTGISLTYVGTDRNNDGFVGIDEMKNLMSDLGHARIRDAERQRQTEAREMFEKALNKYDTHVNNYYDKKLSLLELNADKYDWVGSLTGTPGNHAQTWQRARPLTFSVSPQSSWFRPSSSSVGLLFGRPRDLSLLNSS